MRAIDEIRSETHLDEEVYDDVEKLLKTAEDSLGAWPVLGEPEFSDGEESSLAERMTLWTMASAVGAVTIYSIATNDRRMLMTILGIAVVVMLRLVQRRRKQLPGGRRNAKRNQKGPDSG